MTTKITKEKKETAFSKILETHDEIKLPNVGDLIECSVISIGKSEVILDYKGISSGIVRGKEIQDESGDGGNFKIGDSVKVTVLELDNEKGLMELSFRYASHQQAWDELEKLMKEETVVEAKVIDANKGGLMVKVGNVVGFLPVSQLTTKYYPRVEGGDKGKILGHLRGFIGKGFNVVIIDVDEKESKLIVSQKSAWAEEQKKTLSDFKVGKVVEGKVTGVADFGAFVEFGDNLEGLVHISELAWQRIDNPSDFIKVGDKVQAEIISVDDGRISLSMKKLVKDPWVSLAEKYSVGQKVKGKVLKINPFGAFIELDKDIHGLAHISELSDKMINNPEDVVKIGESYDFTIINLEAHQHRLGLSLKTQKSKEKKEDVEILEVDTKEEIKEISGEDVKEVIEGDKNVEKVKKEKKITSTKKKVQKE